MKQQFVRQTRTRNSKPKLAFVTPRSLLDHGLNLGIFSYDDNTDVWKLSGKFKKVLTVLAEKLTNFSLPQRCALAILFFVDRIWADDFVGFTDIATFLARHPGGAYSTSFN